MTRFLIFIFAITLLATTQISARTIGDFDGDGKTDLTIIRSRNAPQLDWYTLRSSDGDDAAVSWGKPYEFATGWEDFELIGDFDGDGKSDYAIWRTDYQPNDQAYFWILRSSDNVVEVVPW